MTTNVPLQTAFDTAQQLSGFRQNRQAETAETQQQGIINQENQALLQQREQQAQSAQALGQLKAQYGETGDPEVMRQIIMADPEFSSKIQKQFGAIDQATTTQAMNEAGALKQMLETNPEEAMAYWQQNLAQNQAFAGLADNFQAGDIEGAINEIGWGVTALGGQDAYDALFAGAKDPTDFIKDLMSGGIDPKSEEGKAIILEKYGKGNTIGYDVVEAVNPDTGKKEYFQVSRVNPGEKMALGLEVPATAAQIKSDITAAGKAETEKATIQNTLDTVGKILTSPGLAGFSGLDSFRRFIPGSESANVAAWVDQLQSQNFLTAVQQMKGMGALSENEGRKLSAAVAALDPSMSDTALREEITDIQASLLAALEKIESGSLSQQDQPAATSPPAPISWDDM